MSSFPRKVIPNDRQENGQTNEEEEEVEKKEKEIQRRPSRETRENSHSEEAAETLISVNLEEETKKGQLEGSDALWLLLSCYD